MALIKRDQASAIVQDAIVLDLGDLNAQAEAILQRARDEAAAVLRDAREKADKMIAEIEADAAQRIEAIETQRDATLQTAQKEGYDAGYPEGKTAGHELGLQLGKEEAYAANDAQLKTLADSWVRALGEWEAEKGELLAETRAELLKLALAMACKVIRRVPEYDPTIVQDQVEMAMAMIAKPCNPVVMLNPEDEALVNMALPGIFNRLEMVQQAELKLDPMIDRGGRIVRTGSGRIDATVQTQLTRLVDAMFHGENASAYEVLDHQSQASAPSTPVEETGANEAEQADEASNDTPKEDTTPPAEGA